MMNDDELKEVIEDATFDFTMGDNEEALAKLRGATEQRPDAFEAWHALAEVCFGLRDFDEALRAAEAAHGIRPDDLFINTTLSRVWMEKGDKAQAEKFGAQAKILSWKEQIKNPESAPGGLE